MRTLQKKNRIGKWEDWVSLWYKEVWTGKDGKMDSTHNMDDIKVENGRIKVIDNKQRRFPPKK